VAVSSLRRERNRQEARSDMLLKSGSRWSFPTARKTLTCESKCAPGDPKARRLE
jgi:hypothetical protein